LAHTTADHKHINQINKFYSKRKADSAIIFEKFIQFADSGTLTQENVIIKIRKRKKKVLEIQRLQNFIAGSLYHP